MKGQVHRKWNEITGKCKELNRKLNENYKHTMRTTSKDTKRHKGK